MPSFSAASHAPAYHAHEMPFADSVSPIVFERLRRQRVLAPDRRSARSPPFAGGTRDGWYGGCVVLTE